VAGDLLRRGADRIGSLTGALPDDYHNFAAESEEGVEATARADRRLRATLHDAAMSARAGRSAAGTVVDAAHAEAAALRPSSGTAPGQRALLQALRIRVAEQQKVIATYSSRDALLAAAVTSLMPAGAQRRRALPVAGTPFLSATSGNGCPGARGGSTPHQVSSRWRGPGAEPLPGSAGTPLGALTLNSGRREVAAAIVHEAHRRGYTPQQATAILADAMQESDLNPRAVSQNRLWDSIFQQDASYPGRHNPNLAIAEFFNRLDRHGGPASPNIWKSIFWLQQRPGDPSAEVAYRRGRQGYLTEIMAKHAAAVDMYRQIVGA
jgi:hypothetical protein